MKKLNLLLVFLAAIGLWSCNNETVPVENGENAFMNFSMKVVNNQGTRAIEGEHGGADGAEHAPEYTSLTIQMLAADGTTALKTYTLSATSAGEDLAAWNEIKAGRTAKIIVPQAAVSVNVFANVALEATSKIVDFQGFDKVPLTCAAAVAIDKTGDNKGTKDKPFKANVTIAPALARFEVFGKIDLVTSASADVKCKYSKVNVVAVYINNLKLVSNAAGLTLNPESLPDAWDAFYASPDGAYKGMSDKIVAGAEGSLTPIADKGEIYTVTGKEFIGIATGKAAGFNFFSQIVTTTTEPEKFATSPHIIVEVECWDKEVVPAVVPGRKFITIRSFKDSATGTTIASYDAAKIYRMNLQDLEDWFKGGGEPDPNPEMGDYYIDLSLTVTKWVVKNIKPEI